MYLTRGANVRTRRSRTARSFVRRYSVQSASVSSEDRRRVLVVGVASFTALRLLQAGGRSEVSGRARTFRIPESGYRPVDMGPFAPSPVLGRVGAERARTAREVVHSRPSPQGARSWPQREAAPA